MKNLKLITSHKDYLLLFNTGKLCSEGEKSFTVNSLVTYSSDKPRLYTFGCHPLIAHKPLNNAPVLEGIPLLPELDHYPMVLARESAVMNNYDVDDDTYKHGFVKGYEAASQNRRWTDEDMINFPVWMKSERDKQLQEVDKRRDTLPIKEAKEKWSSIVRKSNAEWLEDYKQSLSPVKLLVGFEPETEVDPTNESNWYVDAPSGKYWEDEPVPPSPDNLYTNGTRRIRIINNVIQGRYVYEPGT